MSASTKGQGRIRYFEVGLIVAVVAVLAMLLRPKPLKAPEAPNLAAVRQDLLSVMTPIWNTYDNDLTLSCSPTQVLDVRLSLRPGIPPRRFWLNQVVTFVCANQPGNPAMRAGQIEAGEADLSSESGLVTRMAQPVEPIVDAELSKRGNDVLEQALGPDKALLLVETLPHPGASVTSQVAPAEVAQDAPSAVVAARRPAGAPAPEGKSRRLEESAPEGYLGPKWRRSNKMAAPPRPYFPTAPQYRAYLILSSQLEPSQDQKLTALLTSTLGGPGRPAPSLSLLHLPKHAR